MPVRALAVLLVALVLPAAALAKGPDLATISGTGFDDAVAVAGYGEGGDETPLFRLADSAGFFPLAFGQSPDPTETARPKGDLGPSVRVAWRVPGPDGRVDRLVQDVYPYASPPVSHMAPGQRFFGSERTHGGWLVGTDDLKPVLVDLGLPETAPVPSGGGSVLGIDGAWLALAIAGALVLVLALAAAGALVVTRRPRAA